MTNDFIYPYRNGEKTLPELTADEWSFYWFDGVAGYDNWMRKGNLIVVTGEHKDRVIGLVIVAMFFDEKHPSKDARSSYLRNRAVMFAEPETRAYDLAKCEGRWWGPVHVPRMHDDMLFSMAAVMDYESWKNTLGEEVEL